MFGKQTILIAFISLVFLTSENNYLRNTVQPFNKLLMTKKEWADLLAIVNGESRDEKAIGFIIDSPWMPGWAKVPTLDYYTSDDV